MAIDIMELLTKIRDLRVLTQYGMKEFSVKFACYCPGGDSAWWTIDNNSLLTIIVPVDPKFGCIIPLDLLEQKFRLAHELGHAANGLGVCPNKKCFDNLYIGESCFWREKLAWLNGLEILEKLSILSEDEKKGYIRFALECIKKEARGCIRRLMLDPSKIFENESP